MKFITLIFILALSGCEDYYPSAQTYEAKIYIANCLEHGSQFESICAKEYLIRKDRLEKASKYRKEAEMLREAK